MNILVLCHGNINRSAACAEILRKKIPTVKSAGFTGPGKRAAKKMRDAMVGRGVDLSEHRSQLVTRELVEWAEVIVYMDGGNRKRFMDQFPDMGVKLVCLGRYAEPQLSRIPDPGFMARNSKGFRETVGLIYRSSVGLLNDYKSEWK